MNPHPSPRAPVPPGKHLEAPWGALAVSLGRVGVAIVDDEEDLHVLVRDILDQTREFHWVGSYSNAEAALTGIPQSGAQVVLIDIKMPGMSGIECARRLKALLPHLVIVMVTGFADPRTINLARANGADEFLAKPFSSGQCLAALLFCLQRAKSKVAEPPPSSPNGKRPRHRGFGGRSLTARENNLMENMAEGRPYKEIAARTGVSESAVHHMVTRIFRKLGATNKTEAIRKWENGNRRSP